MFDYYNPNVEEIAWMGRAILYIYIPSFFAEVERKRRSGLVGKPIIVAGLKGNTTGVVLSASAEVMKDGVGEGMNIRHAKQSCPEAAVLLAEHDFYMQVFSEILDILARYSPLLEPDPPDGAYLDVTASRKLLGDPIKISRRIAAQVFKRLGLPVSIGCASNKLVARIASRSCRGVVKVRIGSEAQFVSAFPVTVLDSVNEKIAKELGNLGISTVGQLAMIPERLLVKRFGPAGNVMRKQSLGIDMSPVRATYPPETIIIEHMFDCPIDEPAQIEEHLARMSGWATAKLRKKGALTGEVVLKLFDERPRPTSLLQNREIIASYFRFKKPTDSETTLQQSLAKMLWKKMQPGMQIYRVQIVLSNLTPGESSQLCLIGDGERRNRIDRAIDLIRYRFGEKAIFVASSLAAKDTARALKRIAA